MERIIPDAGDAVGDRDAGQAAAAIERPRPMLVTLSGIVTLVRLVHQENARSPMLVTLLGIVTLVRLVQATERPVPDAGDAVGDHDVGQAGAARTPRPRCW